MEPTNRSLLSRVFVLSLIRAYGINNKAEIIICRRSRDIKDLYQLFKKPSVDLFAKQRKANGAAKIRSSIKIYRKAKLRSKAKAEIESMLVRIPSKEKMVNSPAEEGFKS